jgi:hypothetical protein
MDGKLPTHVYFRNFGKTPAVHIKAWDSVLFRGSTDDWFRQTPPVDPLSTEGLLLQNDGEMGILVFSDEPLPKANDGYMLVTRATCQDIFQNTYRSDVCWWENGRQGSFDALPWSQRNTLALSRQERLCGKHTCCQTLPELPPLGQRQARSTAHGSPNAISRDSHPSTRQVGQPQVVMVGARTTQSGAVQEFPPLAKSERSGAPSRTLSRTWGTVLVATQGWEAMPLGAPVLQVAHFLLRTSSTACRAAVTVASGASAMSWCASTTTCRPRVDNRTRLACN